MRRPYAWLQIHLNQDSKTEDACQPLISTFYLPNLPSQCIDSLDLHPHSQYPIQMRPFLQVHYWHFEAVARMLVPVIILD